MVNITGKVRRGLDGERGEEERQHLLARVAIVIRRKYGIYFVVPWYFVCPS